MSASTPTFGDKCSVLLVKSPVAKATVKMPSVKAIPIEPIKSSGFRPIRSMRKNRGKTGSAIDSVSAQYIDFERVRFAEANRLPRAPPRNRRHIDANRRAET